MAKSKKEKRTKRRSMAANVRKTADKRKQGGRSVVLPSSASFFEIKKGTRAFRVIPYEVSIDNHPQNIDKGDIWYEKTYGLHYKIGPEEKTVVCPRLTLNKPCPVCEEHTRLRRDPDADDDVVRGFKPKQRQLFNICIDGEKEIQVLDSSFYLFGKNLEEEIREGNPENAAFADPEGGKLLKVRWTENDSLVNKFLEASRIDFEDDKELSDKILDLAVDLDKAVVVPSYEEVEKALHGDEEESDDGAPKKKKKKKKDAEEDNIPMEWDEDKPKKKKKKKKK